MDGSTEAFLHPNSQTVDFPVVPIGTALTSHALGPDPISNQQIGVSQQENLPSFQNSTLQNEEYEVEPSVPDYEAQVEELWKLLSPHEPYVPIELSTSPYNPITSREIASYNRATGDFEDSAVMNFTRTTADVDQVTNELIDATSGVVGSTERSIGFSASHGSNISKPRKKVSYLS